MDEESPKKKISVNNFFERVDSVEKVANSSLSKVNSVTAVANANKLLIESLQLSVEAIQTDIRDIANYIIIDHKLEKDLKEDRLLEEQDAQQKKDISEKLLGLKGPQGPQGPQGQQGTRGEDFGSKGGGGSFLGGLLKVISGIGAAGFALKFIAPTLLPLAGKFVFKTLIPALGKAFVGGFTKLGGFLAKGFTGALGKLPLIGKGIKSFGKGIVSGFKKIGGVIAALLSGILRVGGGGGGAKAAESNMSLTSDEGGVDADETSLEAAESGVDADDISNDEETQSAQDKKQNKLLEFVKGGGLAGMAYRKVFGKDKKEDKLESDKRIPIRNRRGRIIGYKDVGNDQVEPILESGDVDSLETSQSKDVEMINTGSEPTPLTTSSPIVDNTTPLVQANPPQISDVSIKPTEANIPFRKLISSKKYLSVSDMNKSGLPPEIAKMLS